jgi:hypothetical protein
MLELPYAVEPLRGILGHGLEDDLLSETERMLKQQGVKTSRRWLREYLSRWGER